MSGSHNRRGEHGSAAEELRRCLDAAQAAGVVLTVSTPEHYEEAKAAVKDKYATKVAGGGARGDARRREKEERRRAVREIAERRGIDLARWPSLSRQDQRDHVAAIQVALWEKGTGVGRERTIREDIKALRAIGTAV